MEIVTPGDAAGEQKEFFCVIGSSVTENHPIRRSWKKTAEEAAAHAEKLINDSFNGRACTTKKLLVVKVVQVVEVEPKPTIRRSATAADLKVGCSSEDD